MAAPKKAVTDVSSEIVTITPELAETWLGKNNRNRRIRRSDVDTIAYAIVRGEWRFTGEAIKFDTKGNLIDGQHRLTAIVEANREVTSLVLRGISPDAQDVMDTGKPRNASDVLDLHSYANTAQLAATARNLINYYEKNGAWNQNPRRVTNLEVLQFVMVLGTDIEVLNDMIKHSKQTSKMVPLRPGIVTAAYYILAKKDDEDAREFFTSLAAGAGLPPGSPILTLRNRMFTIRQDRMSIPIYVELGMIIRAWNAWREKRTMNSLPVTIRGAFPEMPQPV